MLRNDESINSPLENFLEENEEVIDDDLTELNSIQKRYFFDDFLVFERFESVADLIKSGYLNKENLKNEIIYLDKVLANSKMKEKKDKLLKIIDNVFELSDAEVKQKVDLITKEVTKGTYNLPTYLKLYKNLIWLESLSIEGIKISEDVTKKFKEGVKMASRSGELKFVQNLLFQFQWSNDDKSEYAEKYNLFAAYVDEVNNNINDAKDVHSYEEIIKAINSNKQDELYNLISKEFDLRLKKENAKQIYKALINANANTTTHFFNAIKQRYANPGSIISQMPQIEKDFILQFTDLLMSDKKLVLENEKPLSKVPLMFLKDYLYGLINYHFPEDEREKDEK